jgi:cysteinyl-tRNA synthetase
MYTCGPTVYAPAHLGNFRAFLTYDILKRVLSRVYGFEVEHVCNLTDVDDKIINKCREVRAGERMLTAAAGTMQDDCILHRSKN